MLDTTYSDQVLVPTTTPPSSAIAFGVPVGTQFSFGSPGDASVLSTSPGSTTSRNNHNKSAGSRHAKGKGGACKAASASASGSAFSFGDPAGVPSTFEAPPIAASAFGAPPNNVPSAFGPPPTNIVPVVFGAPPVGSKFTFGAPPVKPTSALEALPPSVYSTMKLPVGVTAAAGAQLRRTVPLAPTAGGKNSVNPETSSFDKPFVGPSGFPAESSTTPSAEGSLKLEDFVVKPFDWGVPPSSTSTATMTRGAADTQPLTSEPKTEVSMWQPPATAVPVFSNNDSMSTSVNKKMRSDEMIPIRKADIPAYLHDSEFYLSLQDKRSEDETILVPSDCMKKDVTVMNNDDLRSLLLTLRFWVAGCVCESIIEYAMKPLVLSIEDTLAEFYPDFPALKFLKLLKTSRTPMIESIESGDKELVKYYLKRGQEWPKNACDLIAKTGKVEMLKCAIEAGCKLSPRVSEIAAAEGHLNCLRFLHENGAPCTSATLTSAVRKGHLDCVIFVHQQGVVLKPTMRSSAVLSRSVECVRFLHENGCPWDSDVCKMAANNFDTNMVLYLLRNGCPPDDQIWHFRDENRRENFQQVLNCFRELNLPWSATPRATARVAKTGDLEGLKLLIQSGCPWHSDTMGAILNAGGENLMEVVKFARENGCPWQLETMITIVETQRSDSLELMKYAFENGCPWHLETMNAIIAAKTSGKSLEKMQFAHENGCFWHEDTCKPAARAGLLDCLQYAHTHGAVLSPDTCEVIFEESSLYFPVSTECFQYAHQFGGCALLPKYTSYAVSKQCPLELLKYLHEQGCAWDPQAAEQASLLGLVDYLDYMLSHGCPITPGVFIYAKAKGYFTCVAIAEKYSGQTQK